MRAFVLSALVLLVGLSACGGDSDDPDPTETSASMSTSTTPTADVVTPSVIVDEATPTVLVPTSVPIQESLAFPTAIVEYPDNAPEEIQLPGGFALVATENGDLPTGAAIGWTAQFRFEGSVKDATAQLAEFFEQLGWSSELIEVDSRETLLLLEHPTGSGSGSAIIGGDTDGSTLILLTLRA